MGFFYQKGVQKHASPLSVDLQWSKHRSLPRLHVAVGHAVTAQSDLGRRTAGPKPLAARQ